MAEKKSMTLDAFKQMVSEKKEFADGIIGRVDMVDLDNGVMRIYSEHVNRYLEKYACRDAEDLVDTMWYSYGVFCQVID